MIWISFDWLKSIYLFNILTTFVLLHLIVSTFFNFIYEDINNKFALKVNRQEKNELWNILNFRMNIKMINFRVYNDVVTIHIFLCE